MKQKSKARKKVAKRTVPRARRAKRIAIPKVPPPTYEEINYEGALAKSVLDSHTTPENEDAVTLAAALSSLTVSLKKISYNYGLTVGRSVYRLFEGRRHYKWYGDSIQDAVLFLEKLGYNYILYKILTDNIEISIYRRNRGHLNCNIHSFDAGLIAGFLGAARGDFTKVTEVSCCNNGSDCCKFTTAPSPGDPFCTDLGHVASLLNSAKSDGWVRQEYQVLTTQPLLKPEYAGQMNAIFSRLGEEAMKGFPEGKLSAKAMRKVSETMQRFGLGEVQYTARPQRIGILLDGAKAKKEFVDISISFLNGMIGGRFGRPLRSRLAPARKGSYKITMRQ
jgi:predicted hydrocarbon binding protein